LNKIEQKLNKWLSPVKEDLPPLYLVGGAVRDHLLNREIKDVDIACVKPEETANRIGQYHDSAIVLFNRKQNAVCYRVIDRNNKDDFLDIVQLRNNSILEDLQERDFTFNSIAVQINRMGKIKKFIDPLNGAEDLQNRQIRISSLHAFQSDPLRILRAFRFSAELDFCLEKMTKQLINEQFSLISSISIERIMAEIYKIFATDRAARHIRHMDKIGFLEIIFPEIQKMKGCGQNNHHHLDAWDHSMMVLENCEQITSNMNHYFPESATQIQNNLSMNNRLVLMKMAALLHDIGKPDTRKMSKNSYDITFHNHDRAGQEIICSLAKRVKMSKQDQIFLESMVENHMHILFLSRPDVKEKTVLKWLRKLGDNFIPLVIIEMADCKSTLGPASSEASLDHHLTWSKRMINNYFDEIKQKIEKASIINGKDLIALGMSPGPRLGLVLSAIREAQDLGTIQNYNQGLALAKRIIENHNHSFS
jgi:poly(A) polymerase